VTGFAPILFFHFEVNAHVTDFMVRE